MASTAITIATAIRVKKLLFCRQVKRERVIPQPSRCLHAARLGQSATGWISEDPRSPAAGPATGSAAFSRVKSPSRWGTLVAHLAAMRTLLVVGLLSVPCLAFAEAGDVIANWQASRSLRKEKAKRSILGQMVHGERDRSRVIWHVRAWKERPSFGAARTPRSQLSPRVRQQRHEIAQALWSTRHSQDPFASWLRDQVRKALRNGGSLDEAHRKAMLLLAAKMQEEQRDRDRVRERKHSKRGLELTLARLRRLEGRHFQVFTTQQPQRSDRANDLRQLWRLALAQPSPIAFR
jgi:hypothetical protein